MSHKLSKQVRKETRRLLSKRINDIIGLAKQLSLFGRISLASKIILKRAVKLSVTFLLAGLLSTAAYADTRLNVVTGEAEVVPDDRREWTTQLNPVTGEASVQPVGAAVELNAVTGEAEWDSGHNE